MVRPPNPRYWLHILLFVATIFTTLVVGAKMEFDFQNNAPPFVHGDETLPLFPVGWALHEPSRLHTIYCGHFRCICPCVSGALFWLNS